jgi:peroxiredoxin
MFRFSAAWLKDSFDVPMNRKTIGFVITVFLILMFIGIRSSRTSNSTSPVATGGTNSHAQAAPEFQLKTLDGLAVKLSDFRGKAVVLNFWATWCAPCRVETPWLVDLYRKYKEQGLEIVGISMDEGSPEHVEKFVREMNVSYTVLMGNNSVSDSYGGVRFLPQTFFIDRDGEIASQRLGLKSKNDLENDIKRLLHVE